MASRAEHYTEAERLLAEGVEAVRRIEDAAVLRQGILEDHLSKDGFTVEDDEIASQIRAITAGMDEYGKKAMGIWAQAQVHATLASAERAVEPDKYSHLDNATALTQMEMRGEL